MSTDYVLNKVLVQPEFQREMSTAELHFMLGKYCAEFEKQAGIKDRSILAAAYRAGVPCFCPSPGDSTIGMNIAGLELRNYELRINPSRDVNQSTGVILAAKRAGMKTGALLIGGGSPKNFLLQTEPQIQEVLRLKEEGHDYFIQFTDARPDTGGLSGATPQEAVTWGKVDPLQLPSAIVCYVDSTIAVPLLTHYALSRCKPRKSKRMYDQLPAIMELMIREYWKHNKIL
jgi:deoxyhypusine synthase